MEKSSQPAQVILTICEELKFQSNDNEIETFFNSKVWKDIETWYKLEWMKLAAYSIGPSPQSLEDHVHSQGEAYRITEFLALKGSFKEIVKNYRKEENDGCSED